VCFLGVRKILFTEESYKLTTTVSFYALPTRHSWSPSHVDRRIGLVTFPESLSCRSNGVTDRANCNHEKF
jgi:hypothetical protein